MTGAARAADRLGAVADAVRDLDAHAAAAVLASGLAAASPVATGRLRASWSATGPTITSTAPHAAPVAARSPFLGKAITAAAEDAATAAFAPVEAALTTLEGTY